VPDSVGKHSMQIVLTLLGSRTAENALRLLKHTRCHTKTRTRATTQRSPVQPMHKPGTHQAETRTEPIKKLSSTFRSLGSFGSATYHKQCFQYQNLCGESSKQHKERDGVTCKYSILPAKNKGVKTGTPVR
jgi:hypothetical protein